MSIIDEIRNGMNEGMALAERVGALNAEYEPKPNGELGDKSETKPAKDCSGELSLDSSKGCGENLLARADNLSYMKWLLEHGYKGRIKLIYIDPPFFSKAKYNASFSIADEEGRSHKFHHLAYDDTFERSLEFYICNITARLVLMKELLSDDGTLWIHLDWHSSHYVKLILDELMGEKNFVNEIIWSYKSGGSSSKHFSRKHDTILVYAKSSQYYLEVAKEKSYNRDLKPYNFKGVEEYKDDYGWYTMVNAKDVWSIDMVGRTSKERTGYATQKPMELMERIVCSASKAGDICADFFCGSGSLLEAAEGLGRKWIGCDVEELALGMSRKRLELLNANYRFITDANERRLRRGCLEFDLSSSEELEDGRRLCTFSLSKFIPDIDIGHIPFKERDDIEDLANKCPQSFIDYIMVDAAYKGRIQGFATGSTISSDWDRISVVASGRVAFIAVDVFGREYFFECDLN